MTEDFSENLVSKKLVEFLADVCTTCPAKWVPQSLEIVEHILDTFSPLWDINPEARKGFILSNKSG